MGISIEEAKAFILDAQKSRENWLVYAERSWMEIKKRQENRQIFSVTPNSLRRRSRYPVWYSVFKIRQPLILSRIGVPIGKDTTQDGNDNIGATAAICLERLAVNLVKTFDFFDVLCAARDDFLATCFGTVRAYYERDEVKERVKEYITPQKGEDDESVVFVDSQGNAVESDDIGQDEQGYFVELDKVVDVENERICLEPILYRDVYIDPDIRHWNKCKRIAFASYYSQEEFRAIFGAAALSTIAQPDADESAQEESGRKRQCIKVYEYWDEYSKECLWWAENGTDFVRPLGYYVPEEHEESLGERNGLYDLEGFFPCPPPLVMNQATDEYWPVPEYYQLAELIQDIHTIFSRMMAATRSVRSRLLFDNNVEGLQEALNEAAEGDAFGVPNLAQSLVSAGGSLDNVVQYIPVEKIIQGLQQLYEALEQRLNMFYKLTGMSDLLQGLITDPTQRTFGERQMLEKYALNQSAEPQRKMQEFVRSCYQLVCEMALKNFEEESLDRYIMPQTLTPDHRDRYPAAIALLKNNQKRFRIELETDSTIAMNEQYDKAMRVELVNALTTALEKTAQIAQTSPALVVTELHCLKYLVQGFRQGKLFQNEITAAIDNVIKEVQSAPQPFNKDQAQLQLAQSELAIDAQAQGTKMGIEQSRLSLDAQKLALENFKAQQVASHDQQMLNLKQQVENMTAQMNWLMYQLEAQKAGVEIQNKLADNKRLEMQTFIDAQTAQQPRSPEVVVIPSAPAPPVIVAPQAAPQTIINAPNPTPQTSVIQPVQQVPVPIIPGVPTI